jgi:hypothetical protein
MAHETAPSGESLHDYLLSLTGAGSVLPQPDEEAWPETIERISVAGRIAQISDEVWNYFLDVLPPKLMGRGYFCFAEGQEPLRVFWRRGGACFARQLTQAETERVCDLSGLPRDYGSY